MDRGMYLEGRSIQKALWAGLLQNYSVMRNEEKILGLDESKMFTLAKAAFDINILDHNSTKSSIRKG